MLWAGSMPCLLAGDQNIPVAQYGKSNIGQMKTTYREGLSHRYGKAMQTIAGLHYNFSLPEAFWTLLNTSSSEGYLALIRNFRRYSWLLMYLFGASPAMDSSFFDPSENNPGLEKLGRDTLFLPYATSLRMSDMGYTNNAQSSLNICYNTLEEYIESLWQAIQTPYKPYQQIGIKSPEGEFKQLNANVLQIENEYYSTIRPKRISHSGEKPLTALSQSGVEYVEVRCIDINPFEPLGINHQDADFLDIFLMYCAIQESMPIEAQECRNVTYNFERTVLEGRRPGLQLNTPDGSRLLTQWGTDLLDNMLPIVQLMDSISNTSRYSDSFRQQREKLANSAMTPSGKVLSALSNEPVSHIEFMLGQSQRHQRLFKQHELTPERIKYFQQIAQRSRLDQAAIEKADTVNFETFLQQYQLAD